MKNRVSISFLAIIILLMGFTLTIFAQDDVVDDLLFEVTGEVNFGAGGEIMVDGMIIAPAGAFNPSSLKEGDIVTVTGYLLNDDTLQAVSLETPDDSPEATPEPEITPEPEVTPTPEPGSACGNPSHPIANRIAAEFKVSYETVMAMHCAGNGFGNITRAFLLAKETGKQAQEFLNKHHAGQGWGQIVAESGVDPAKLAPGKPIGKKDDDSETQAQAAPTEQPGNGNGNGGGGNGGSNGNNGGGNSGGNGRGNGNGGNGGGNGGGKGGKK